MLTLDVLALVELTKRFLPGMLARNRGWVLQVASIGAFQPSPTYATYSAAKAFVLSFGEALAYELRASAVRVTVVSPGATRTEFLDVSGQKSTFFQRATFMDARSVAEAGLRAMLRGRASVVPGLSNQIAAFSVRLLPRRVQAAIANFAMNVS
jgi:short-subunit dehydrogenase